MATPTPSDTVAPPFAAADLTCPGPVVGVRDRSCQTCPTGKYPYISNTSSSERLPIFSPSTVPESTRRLPSAEAVMVSQLIDPAPLDNPSHRAALPSPGRSLDGTMEVPNRSVAVALPASGQPSRPGPAFGSREGVFQQSTPGEYSESTVFYRPDNFPACSPPHHLTIYYQNIRGMRTKTDKLRLALLSSDYDVVVLTETWLHGKILDSEFSANYKIFRLDRNAATSSAARGGGALVAVKSDLGAREVELANCERLEQSTVRINFHSFSLFVCGIYVRPRTTPDVYTLHAESVQQILEKATDQDVVVVVGDYNLPDLVWVFDEDVGGFLPANASSDAEVALTESFLANGLVQINFLLNNSNRLLDLAFVNDAAAFELLQPPNSLLPIDAPHPPFVLKLEICAHTPASESIDPVAEEFDFKRCNFETLNSRLEAVDWSTMDTAGSLDDAVTEFYDQLLNVLRDTVPVRARRFRCPSRTPPWWNSQLRNLRNQLRKARKRFVNRSSWGNKVTLSYLETEFAEQQVTSYQNYIAGVQDNLQSNPKNFWSYVKERKQVGEIPTDVSYREEKSTSPEAAANLFARFFETVHSSQDPTVPPEQLNELATYNINLPLLTVSVAEVKKALGSVDAAKGPGPDRIPPSVVKNCCSSLARPVTSIFNRSLSEGAFPSEWKVASITPIHKSGSRAKVENYRSISILSCLAKVLEKLLVDHIYPSVKNIISEYQHGFMKQRSTTSNLMAYTNWIIRRMEKRQQVDAVYIDFAKAFDRVPHKLTIAKLTALGLPDWVTRWLNSYLVNRSAYVKIAGSLSTCYEIPSGVPQGSHLGPLIFVLFINDLCSRLQSCKLLYADDLKIFRRIGDSDDVRALQEDINVLLRWCVQNGMEVNEKKCKLISFYRIRSPNLAEYNMGRSTLERVHSIVDLGVTIDCKMEFNQHVSISVAKSYAMLGFLRRNAAGFTDVRVLKTLYFSLVRSVLEYAVPVWAPYYAVHQQKIESIQRRFVRFAARVLPWNDPVTLAPYTNLCALVGLPTLQHRRVLLQRLFVFDVLRNNIDCSDLLEEVHIRVPSRELRNHQLLDIPRHTTNYGHHNPLDACCRKFNHSTILENFDFNVCKSVFRSRILLLS